MKLTDLNISYEKKLISKLELMIKRIQKKDVVLLIEGSEGDGKSNASEVIGYYIKYRTNRTINMFFRLESLIEFAKKTSEQIIIWDEPSLDSLSTDWYSQTSKNLIRLLMTCRKKKHFFIINMVKFYKFSEYLVVDRSHGFIHIYTRGDGQQGRFVYIKKNNLERLYLLYKTKRMRGYKQLKSFGGWIPLIEDNFDKLDMSIENKPHCSLMDYENLKDKAIESIGETPELKKSKYLTQRNALFFILNKKLHYKQEDIKDMFNEVTGETIEQQTISVAIQEFV